MKPLQPLKIGPHVIDTPLVLAPMAGVTDRPFRQLCKSQGAGLAVSEMVGAMSLLHGSEKTKRRANHVGETTPRAVQIVGAQPEMMAEAARINEAEGAQIIDINMGCPAKKVCNMAAGSALLQHEELVVRILAAVVGAVDIPVTLKIRTGWDTHNRNGLRIAKLAESVGIQALAVHGRTRACMFRGQAEYDTIAEIKSEVNIPIIANGDINTPEQALAVFEKTKADAVMVGRAAQGRPWIFNEIAHFLKTGTHLAPPDVETVWQLLRAHVIELYDFYGEGRGTRVARKHVSWYSKGHAHGAQFRDTFNRLETADEQMKSIDDFFQGLLAKGFSAA